MKIFFSQNLDFVSGCSCFGGRDDVKADVNSWFGPGHEKWKRGMGKNSIENRSVNSGKACTGGTPVSTENTRELISRTDGLIQQSRAGEHAKTIRTFLKFK